MKWKPLINLLGRRPRIPIPNERLVIVHNHVFKNAGSSIDWALKRNFGDGFFDHRDDLNMRTGAGYVATFLRDHPHVSALSTHHLRPPLPEMDRVRFMTIMMLRHPLERVTSVYRFERQQKPADTLGAKFARSHTLRQYVLWRMQPDVPPTIRNFHIFRSLPGPFSWKNDIGPRELAQARAYIDSVELLGLVERFDESMVLFESSLRPVCPTIDLSYRIQNVGQNPAESLAERIEMLRAQIGEAAFALLADRNQSDLELYAYARQKFEERWQRSNAGGDALTDFQRRCRVHRDPAR